MYLQIEQLIFSFVGNKSSYFDIENHEQQKQNKTEFVQEGWSNSLYPNALILAVWGPVKVQQIQIRSLVCLFSFKPQESLGLEKKKVWVDFRVHPAHLLIDSFQLHQLFMHKQLWRVYLHGAFGLGPRCWKWRFHSVKTKHRSFHSDVCESCAESSSQSGSKEF